MDRYVAFIPVRGGSKSIPLKNIKEINGRPLLFWTLDATVNCQKIDRVYVSTDCDAIREKVREYGEKYHCEEKLICIDRPPETATDTASTESAMLHFANMRSDFSHIILVQATSPLLTHSDLSAAISDFESGGYDSLLSVVRQKRFCWKETQRGFQPVNYDYRNRPRRQEFDGFLVENGAFYINTRNNLLKEQCRLSGFIGTYEMNEDSYFEIDEPNDWQVIEQLLRKRERTVKKSGLGQIKMLLTDCDGVLTDGGMYYSENGDELKKFNTRDGMGVQILREHGIRFGIITGENSELVRRRAQKLRADECYLGISDKLKVLDQICEKYQLRYEEIAYIGDDRNDVSVLCKVGFPCSVSDATVTAKNVAAYITRAKGGEGAVREVVEKLIEYCGNKNEKD